MSGTPNWGSTLDIVPMEVGQKSDTSTISFEEILGVRVRAEE